MKIKKYLFSGPYRLPYLRCLTDESGFEIFCHTPKKRKKKKSFKNVLCKGDSINSPWDRRVDWYQSEVQNITYVFEWP